MESVGRDKGSRLYIHAHMHVQRKPYAIYQNCYLGVNKLVKQEKDHVQKLNLHLTTDEVLLWNIGIVAHYRAMHGSIYCPLYSVEIKTHHAITCN